MKKIYHLVLMEKDMKFIPNYESEMRIVSDTIWFDLDRATDRARSMVHNEFMNDGLPHSVPMCKLEEITTDKLKEGIIFLMSREDWDHESPSNTLWRDKFIVLIKEKDLLVNILANFCEKVNPGYINGMNYGKEKP